MSSTDEPGAATVPTPVGRLASVSLDCTYPTELADFYGRLLGMSEIFATPDRGIVAVSDDTFFLTMMRAEHHVAPTWPEPGQLQQMHIDISVADLDQAVASAVALGAREADHQPAPSVWRVLIDPAGHPFCLTTSVPD